MKKPRDRILLVTPLEKPPFGILREREREIRGWH
jgi:hypothetical protein